MENPCSRRSRHQSPKRNPKRNRGSGKSSTCRQWTNENG
jgi:hypothetical protein